MQYGDNGKNISVYNCQRDYAANGPQDDIYGYAYLKDPAAPGELTVHLDGGSPNDAPYWVLALGEVVDGQYQWAIVSDNLSASLFVLARDYKVFEAKYDTLVLAELTKLGFQNPIAIYQGDDCLYAPSPAAPTPVTTLAPVTSSGKNQAVTALDVNQYIGRWYQAYADEVVLQTFERNAYCVTADYGLNTDGTLSVYNYQTNGAANGSAKSINGYAYYQDITKPGELTVHLDGTPADAPYWILSLGEVVSGQYQWAIVSDNNSATLFVLVRDYKTFRTTYEAEVVTEMFKLGFTQPIVTYQNDDCLYAPKPTQV